MAKIETLADRPIPKKSWGWEEWIVNNELYCGKKLHFTHDGGMTSSHFHRNKHETMYVERGRFSITIDGRVHQLGAGQSVVIPPHTVHRIMCENVDYSVGEAVIIEFSTHHEDSDSIRLAP